MKHIRFILFLAAGALFSQGLHATILLNEQFAGYSTGTLGVDSSHGSLNGWNLTSASITLTNGSGSLDGVPLGLVASDGDRAFLAAYTNSTLSGARNQFAASGTFRPDTETNVYYSFLYKFVDAADVSVDGQYVAQVFRGNSGIGTPQHWMLLAKNVGGQIQLGISKAGAPNNVTNYATTNINAGDTIFVVVRQHIIPGIQNDIYDLWINPPPQFFGTNETDVPPSAASVGAQTTDGAEDQSNTGPGRFVIFAGPSAQVDEVRIATTWAEATPYVGQCLSPTVRFLSATNVTQSAEISTSFRINALGTSPSIQWQLSSDNGVTWADIPDATVATLTTPNLPISANGSQYRAIVSVACNSSSVTSSVASVTLTNPVVTPVGLVVDDTFLDPDLGFESRNNEPFSVSNSLWYSATDESVPGLVAYLQGGNLVGTPNSGSSSLWLGYFTETSSPPVHLDVGRAVKVTLPFTVSGFNFHTNNGSLRIGMFDYYDVGSRIITDGNNVGGSQGLGNGVRGYILNLAFGPTFSDDTPLQIMARTSLSDNNLMGTTGDYTDLGSGPAGGSYSNAPAFQPGVDYTLEFTVARTGVNSADITTSITGGGTNWTWSVTDTNYVYHRFDSFAMRPNSLETTADSFTFPDFKVEVLQSQIAVTPFNISSVQLLSPGAVKLTWDSVSGINYRIESSDSLSPANWVTNATIQATSGSTSYTNSPISSSVTQRFYRVVAAP